MLSLDSGASWRHFPQTGKCKKVSRSSWIFFFLSDLCYPDKYPSQSVGVGSPMLFFILPCMRTFVFCGFFFFPWVLTWQNKNLLILCQSPEQFWKGYCPWNFHILEIPCMQVDRTYPRWRWEEYEPAHCFGVCWFRLGWVTELHRLTCPVAINAGKVGQYGSSPNVRIYYQEHSLWFLAGMQTLFF